MTHPVLTLATFLQTQWLAALAAIRIAHEAHQAMKGRLIETCGEQGSYVLSDWETRVPLKKLFGDFADEIERAMSSELRRIGFPAQVSLTDFDTYGQEPQFCDSSERDLGAFFLQELAHAESRSLLVLAEQMVERFSPERARLASLEEAACRVFAYFAGSAWKPRPVQIVERRGKKVLSHHIYCETYSPWRMNHGGRDELGAVIDGMRLLLADVERGHSVQSNNGELAQLLAHGRFESRMSVEVGPALSLVFFKEKIEFHFAPDVLDLLQASIATYRLLAQEAA